MRIMFAALMLASVSAHASTPFCFNGMHGECEIAFEDGGTASEYEPLIAKLKAEHRPVMIRGECRSYCTILASKLRSQTCLEAGASMWFHKLRSISATGKVLSEAPIDYPSDIASWISAHGGLLPARAVKVSIGGDVVDSDFLVMPHEEALAIWPACK